MSAIIGPVPLATTGSTGNNTHASVGLNVVPSKIAANLIIEAVGATPTITATLQGTLDPGTVVDGSAQWFNISFFKADSSGAATESANQTQTTTGAFPMYVGLSRNKFARRLRLVTTANTNVTYRCELHQQFEL